jgi:hypothetical protein
MLPLPFSVTVTVDCEIVHSVDEGTRFSTDLKCNTLPQPSPPREMNFMFTIMKHIFFSCPKSFCYLLWLITILVCTNSISEFLPIILVA